jgi:hypothetical protein
MRNEKEPEGSPPNRASIVHSLFAILCSLFPARYSLCGIRCALLPSRRWLLTFRHFVFMGLLLTTSGCLEDLVRSYIPVYAGDSEPGFPDFRTDFDGDLPKELTITGLSPDHGPFIGGTELTIFGVNFTNAMNVRIGGRQVQVGDLQVLSPMTLRVVTPAGEVGPADAVVEGQGETAQLAGGFTYDPLYLEPGEGPSVGGTLVSLISHDPLFSKTPQINLGGAPLTEVKVISASVLQGRTPAGAVGPVDLTIGGAPLTEVKVISASVLQGRTPAGAVGPVDLTIVAEGKEHVVREAFAYYASTDPKSGGLGGGPIEGALTISVLDWMSRQPLPGAKVIVQQGRAFTLTASANAQGIALFTGSDLRGPVTISAAAENHATSSLVNLDARDVTIFLMPIIPPEPGPIPPAPLPGTVTGNVMFGGSVGVGSPQWKIVPEPKANQIKRTYVYTTSPSIDWGPQYASGSATIDFSSTGNTAWPYSIVGRTGGMAVYAVAGLYHQSTGEFDPYAMGITRGVVVGPGEIAQVDVWIDIPLTEKVTVQVKNAPTNLDLYELRLATSLGADGVMLRADQVVSGAGLFASQALGKLPSFGHQGLTDASYIVDLALQSATTDKVPYARAVERLVQPQAGVLLLDHFVGVAEQVKPAPGTPLQGNTLMWSSNGETPSLAVTDISLTDQTPHWLIISRGDINLVKLPDPAAFGLPAWPTGTLIWRQWLARIPGFDFNSYTYRFMGSGTWDRWSYQTFELKTP